MESVSGSKRLALKSGYSDTCIKVKNLLWAKIQGGEAEAQTRKRGFHFSLTGSLNLPVRIINCYTKLILSKPRKSSIVPNNVSHVD